MFKKITPVVFIVVTMASCSSMKPLNSSNSKQAAGSSAVTRSAPASDNKGVKFLDDISVNPASSDTRVVANKTSSGKQLALGSNNYLNRSSSVEKASELQLKYA